MKKLVDVCRMVRMAAVLLIATFLTMPAAYAGATVVKDPVIWNDDKLYRTVLTPTSLPVEGPADSFDKLYNFEASGLTGQRAISEAAPGDTDYNGGRWMEFFVTFTSQGISVHDPDGDGVVNFELTSEDQLMDHVALGHIVIPEFPEVLLVCPAIKTKDNTQFEKK